MGDAIDAVAELIRRGRNVDLRLFRKGDVDRFTRQAKLAGVENHEHFEGSHRNPHVLDTMNSSHLVLIPSRHCYPEDLPNVFYEAFATRATVICSNHPMFEGIVREDAVKFVPEQRPLAFADAVELILCDHEIYRKMSTPTLDARHHFQCPVQWHALMDHRIGDSPEVDRWLAERSIASGRYPVWGKE